MIDGACRHARDFQAVGDVEDNFQNIAPCPLEREGVKVTKMGLVAEPDDITTVIQPKSCAASAKGARHKCDLPPG